MKEALQEAIINEAIGIMDENGATVNEAVPWATMRYMEGHGHHSGMLAGDRVTVGYGRDRQMEAGTVHPDSWWDIFPPVEGFRFRVFIEDGNPRLESSTDEVMGAIGATPVGEFPDDVYDSYDNRDRTAFHYVLPDNSPIHTAVSGLR